MEKRLLDEFYEKQNILKRKNLKIEELNPIKDNSTQATNQIISDLNIPKSKQNILKFICYEMTGNIYDHSKFSKACILGEKNNEKYDLIFIDNGISIIDSFKNANFTFENDCDALLKAINGLSTKNELGFIERGTGLNNTINIVINGFKGEILLISGGALMYLNNDEIIPKKIPKDWSNGTIVYIRMKLNSEIDMYNYLKYIEYKI